MKATQYDKGFPVYVSGSNYFNEEDLGSMISMLNAGETIHVGIDCIGHTRNNMTQEEYKEALEKHYGDRLQSEIDEGVCSYSYYYKLKED